MSSKKIMLSGLFCAFQMALFSQNNDAVIYKSDAYTIYNNRIEQGPFRAIVISPVELSSDYRSPDADKFSPTINFKFSINTRDNEMVSGKDHHVTLVPVNGQCVTEVTFGSQVIQTNHEIEKINLPPNTQWTIRLNMREVLKAFKDKGFYTFFNGEKLEQADFKGVYIAGSAAPLIWDFNNLHTRPGLQLTDPDGDGVYETTLILNAKSNEKHTAAHWKMANNTASFPQYKSDYPISEAVYNLALDEMMNAVETDSTFRTGKEWAGVWTRDISYSIILSMAYLQPKVSMYSLMRKVKEGRITQDTGTGGAYPVSTDRIVWAVAAWEIYKSTGDRDWLKKVFPIIKKSVEDDLRNIFDKNSGLVHGESSFLDWREQTYPGWMQPADIYESENLGTNAVHYQANYVMAQMALLLGDKPSYEKYSTIAGSIKKGINNHLWIKDKGYYGQFLYGRNYKMLSSRSEALGEALCVLFGIADSLQQKSIIANLPVTDFGIPCIYPQIQAIPPYHNNAVWPFVQSYWALASAKAGNEKSVVESFAAVYRPAALFLTNKENFVAVNGDFAGTQINSDNMLWSLSGSISLIHRVIFGIEFQADRIVFNPFIPESLKGHHRLTNFKYRNSNLDIEIAGFGSRIKSFSIDGVACEKAVVPGHLKGRHTLEIVMADEPLPDQGINKRAIIFAPATPVINFSNGKLSWNPIPGEENYELIKNGKVILRTPEASVDISAGEFAEYQVAAIGKSGISSFASEPVVVVQPGQKTIYEVEDFMPKSSLGYTGYNGSGFVEISKTNNRLITIPVVIKNAGIYSVNFRYSNGNGPVNTENKCAIRTLRINGKIAGTFVFPQRGKEEWSAWGYSNSIHVYFKAGKADMGVVFEPENENMYGEVNQAMVDAVYLVRITGPGGL